MRVREGVIAPPTPMIVRISAGQEREAAPLRRSKASLVIDLSSLLRDVSCRLVRIDSLVEESLHDLASTERPADGGTLS